MRGSICSHWKLRLFSPPENKTAGGFHAVLTAGGGWQTDISHSGEKKKESLTVFILYSFLFG